jgi:hypothetical protein
MSTRRTFASFAAALALSLPVLPTHAAVAAESAPVPFEAGAAVRVVQGYMAAPTETTAALASTWC